jgi:hypothetical protein
VVSAMQPVQQTPTNAQPPTGDSSPTRSINGRTVR